MSLRRDRRGFIFSLDATLAMLVVMIVMAGVARVSGPDLIYGQHGYLRLERYANDALEVMQLTGTTDDIRDLLNVDNATEAENLVRARLRKILPTEVQFRLTIGNNDGNPRLDVYPDDKNLAGWRGEFENAEERAVAVRVSIFSEENENRFEQIILHVWRGPVAGGA